MNKLIKISIIVIASASFFGAHIAYSQMVGSHNIGKSTAGKAPSKKEKDVGNTPYPQPASKK